MEDFELNVPVVLLFFIRSDTFSKVFEAVRQAKPKKLYLFQDGARENKPDDLDKMMQCRKIVENIDWECEVHKNYSTKNLGCDPAEHAAISWAFDNEERIIYIEDDDVPSQSFFRYCQELLERYENDKRIFMICGRNQLGETHYDNNSYFFSQVDSIWGWASWRDRWLLTDYKHNFLNDPKLVEKVVNTSATKYDGKSFIKKCEIHRKDSIDNNKVSSYESAIRAAIQLNDMLSIVPAVNLVKNIGITGDSVHTASSLKSFPKRLRNIYLINCMEIEFPLKHPDKVSENKQFAIERLKLLGSNNAVRRYFCRVEGFIRRNFIPGRG